MVQSRLRGNIHDGSAGAGFGIGGREDQPRYASEHDGADRYEYIEQVAPGFRSQRYYTFGGGCMWWEFDFDDDATAALSIELGDRLVIVTRDAVNESIRESFIDEDL